MKRFTLFISPVNILQFIFIFQALFSIALLWNNQRFHGLLIVSVLMLLSMSFNILEELNITREVYLVTPVFTLAKGPAFYFFVARVVYPDRQFSLKTWIHFVPALLTLPITHVPQLVIGLGSVSQIIYAVQVMVIVLRYHKASNEMRADADQLNLNWIIFVLVAYIVLGVVDIIRLNLQPYITLDLNLAGQFFGTFSGLILFSYLIYKGNSDLQLFNNTAAFKAIDGDEQELKEANDNMQKVFEQLKDIIIEDSLHHQPRLTLGDLSDKTGLNQRDISRTINLVNQTSFCDFINQLRVNDFKNQITQGSKANFNLLDLAFAVGFSSKSSFNSVFKKLEKLTPSQFVKSLKLDQSVPKPTKTD